MEETSTILDLISQGGIVGLLAYIIVGYNRKWWVPGWLYKEKEASEKEWKDLALQGTVITKVAVDLAKNGLK